MIRKKDKIILMTGGHAGSTAYAVVEEIKRQRLPWKIYFLGSVSAVEGKRVQTYEEKVLPTIGVVFLPIITGRLQRKFSIWTIPSILKIPIGFISAAFYLIKLNPNVVLSFGGFVGFPVVLMAKLLGKKIIIHEQTSVAGLSNRYSSFFANKIAISRESSVKYFPKDKVVLTGNPVSKEVLELRPKQTLNNPPVVLVTGGSRGSRLLNKTVHEILPKLLEKFEIIHQVGEQEYDKFLKIRGELKEDSSRYQVFSVIPPLEWKKVLSYVDIVISRAGANTVSELMIAKIPSILIPIPFIYLNEQTVNARALEDFGLASVVLQKDLTPKRLELELNKTLENWTSIKDRVRISKSPDTLASEKLVLLLGGI